ncbi:MAG: Dihydroneopterin aldolase [Candidatus Omnitrophica bacterium ADurb.Bin277]|nr:MAG: Dihydroneopterin aldolase [Candidatus Omnitrophica bacterium ADurb.Bin277]
MDGKIFIQGLKVRCIIGTLPRERRKKQTVLIDLEFPAPVRKPAQTDDLRRAVNYQRIAGRASEFVSKSRFYLIETLAERLAAVLLGEFPLASLSLTISKPDAVKSAESVGIRIERKRR